MGALEDILSLFSPKAEAYSPAMKGALMTSGQAKNQTVDLKPLNDQQHPIGPVPKRNLIEYILAQVPAKYTPKYSPQGVTPTATPYQAQATPTRQQYAPTAIPTAVQYAPTATPTSIQVQQPVVASKSVIRGRNPSTLKVNVQPVVSNAIETAAKMYGLPSSLLYDVAYGESSLQPNPPLVIDQYGREHKGLFQFDANTWKTLKNYGNMEGSTLKLPEGVDFTDPFGSAIGAAYLISHGQLGRWTASVDSWGKYYKDQELEPYYSQSGG